MGFLACGVGQICWVEGRSGDYGEIRVIVEFVALEELEELGKRQATIADEWEFQQRDCRIDGCGVAR
jgi:hypothetical protein